MKRKYEVKLNDKERDYLNKLISNENTPVRCLKTSQILLSLDASEKGKKYTDREIRKEVKVASKTIERILKKFVEGGLEEVFRMKLNPNSRRRKFDEEGDAKFRALCYSSPPDGHARWTLKLLADKMVEYKIVDSISREMIRRKLKKMNLRLR